MSVNQPKAAPAFPCDLPGRALFKSCKNGSGHNEEKVGGGAVDPNGNERFGFGHGPKSRLLRTGCAEYRDFLRAGIGRVNKGALKHAYRSTGMMRPCRCSGIILTNAV